MRRTPGRAPGRSKNNSVELTRQPRNARKTDGRVVTSTPVEASCHRLEARSCAQLEGCRAELAEPPVAAPIGCPTLKRQRPKKRWRALRRNFKKNPEVRVGKKEENTIVFMEISIGPRKVGRLEIELKAGSVPADLRGFRQLITGERGTIRETDEHGNSRCINLHYKGSRMWGGARFALPDA